MTHVGIAAIGRTRSKNWGETEDKSINDYNNEIYNNLQHNLNSSCFTNWKVVFNVFFKLKKY
jgi:hypothetical protein